MTITLSQQYPFSRLKGDTLILPLFRGEKKIAYIVPTTIQKLIAAIVSSKEFQGGLMETQLIPVLGSRLTRVCLVGLGEKKELTNEKLSRAIGAAVLRVKKVKAKAVHCVLRSDLVKGGMSEDLVGAAALGARRANYHFAKYKRKKDQPTALRRLELLIPTAPTAAMQRALRRTNILADALDQTKDLCNIHAGEATPAYLASTAQALAKTIGGLTVKVLGKKELEKEKCGGILAVGQGSQHESKLIVLEYDNAPKGTKPIVFVGKAITFDSGGISLKPWKSMDEMKFDMCGGAVVIGLLEAVARLQLPLHVVGLVAAAENMPSHTAYKPGDVVTIADGTTVEIVTTDAEGRMVVADALVYARRYKPRTIIDVATLTGAVIVALGDYATGLFTDDLELVETLEKIGEETGDRVWRLPIVKEWNDGLKSPIADLKNIALPRAADATMGALFLKHFVEKKTQWAHLDIAGTAWQTKANGHEEAGATGASLQLLLMYLEKKSTKE